jgi:hypothetical protein
VLAATTGAASTAACAPAPARAAARGPAQPACLGRALGRVPRALGSVPGANEAVGTRAEASRGLSYGPRPPPGALVYHEMHRQASGSRSRCCPCRARPCWRRVRAAVAAPSQPPSPRSPPGQRRPPRQPPPRQPWRAPRRPSTRRGAGAPPRAPAARACMRAALLLAASARRSGPPAPPHGSPRPVAPQQQTPWPAARPASPKGGRDRDRHEEPGSGVCQAGHRPRGGVHVGGAAQGGRADGAGARARAQQGAGVFLALDLCV